MPKRVNPKWGWTGTVRLEGYDRPDDALGELDSHSEPAGDQRQALHRPLTGAQCDDLIKVSICRCSTATGPSAMIG